MAPANWVSTVNTASKSQNCVSSNQVSKLLVRNGKHDSQLFSVYASKEGSQRKTVNRCVCQQKGFHPSESQPKCFHPPFALEIKCLTVIMFRVVSNNWLNNLNFYHSTRLAKEIRFAGNQSMSFIAEMYPCSFSVTFHAWSCIDSVTKSVHRKQNHSKSEFSTLEIWWILTSFYVFGEIKFEKDLPMNGRVYSKYTICETYTRKPPPAAILTDSSGELWVLLCMLRNDLWKIASYNRVTRALRKLTDHPNESQHVEEAVFRRFCFLQKHFA